MYGLQSYTLNPEPQLGFRVFSALGFGACWTCRMYMDPGVGSDSNSHKNLLNPNP